MIRVLIADDHAIVRMGLASLLATKKGFEVVGDASDGATAVRKCAKLKPDVAVVDLMMPGADGNETVKAIKSASPETAVLILTSFGTADALSKVLDAGASGAVLKSTDYSDFVTAIRTVASGGRYIDADIRHILATEPPVEKLTPRQLEVLRLIVRRGLTNEDIAAELGISVEVAKEHVSNVYHKLHVGNRSDAVYIAMHRHLV